MTFRLLVGSLSTALKKTFDDTDISDAQIAVWCTFFINKYRTARIQSESTGRYTTIFPNVPIYTPTTSTINYIAGRKYLILPSNILDLPNDEGISYISYNQFSGYCPPPFTATQFTRTTINSSGALYFDVYQTPQPDNPYFYLIANNIVYLLGVECINLNSLEIGLIISFDPLNNCVTDENMDLDEALVSDVYKNVLELGRFVMLVPSNTVNDASDSNENAQAQKQRVVSVNQSQENQPTE